MQIETIQQAKDFLKANYQDGTHCPCCNQNVKLHKRKLNSSMAHALLIMYGMHKQKGGLTYFKMNQEIAKLGIPSTNIEYAKLKYWGLAEERVNITKEVKSSGLWRLTERGALFAVEQLSVPKYVFVYNGECRKFSKETTNIKQALSSKFNYQELIQSK